MENKNRYPEHIMKTLRQRLGLEEDDASRDEFINTYSPSEAFEEVCNWEGLINYASEIKWWIESIYGVDLDTIETEDSLDSLFEDMETESECVKDCPYFYADEYGERPQCHYHNDGGCAPCEYPKESEDF